MDYRRRYGQRYASAKQVASHYRQSTLSREALAVAHATGKHPDVIIAAGMVSPVGILILRWIDNDDLSALRRAKGSLMRQVQANTGCTAIRALVGLHRALSHLKHQRCQDCGGTGDAVQANGVVMRCPNQDCNDGLIARLQGTDAVHHRALAIIRRQIGASLAGLRDRI